LKKSNEGLRSEQRGKRRKTNLILNGLIGLVILLIIIVSVSIFGKNEEKSGAKLDQSVEVNNSGDKVSSKGDSKKTSSSKDADSKEESKQDKSSDEDSASKTSDDDLSEESEPVITDGGGANIERTIVDPSWEPVGTTQAGEHTAVYDQNSVDWQEMVDAMEYATGIEASNMTVWFLGNNGQNQSVGTISTKDKLETYRVYIEWQDNGGWVPTKVEELIQNDKAQ
jgi:hypothetical protein